MKNIFGTTEDLRLTDENGVLRYEYKGEHQYTYDSIGNVLTYDNSDGFWSKNTYNSNGKQLTYYNSYGYWNKRTYDSSGNQLKYENSFGYWSKSTYDSNGKRLTFEDSDGEKREFDIKQYTIQELEKKLGHSFIII